MTDATTTGAAAVDTAAEERTGAALGTASTDQARMVEQTIGRIAQWRGRQISYAPVFGGLMNSNWRVRVDEEDFFVKIPGPGSEAFIDRDTTHIAGMRAGEAGISARHVAYFPDKGIEVIEFLDGYRACTNGDMKRPDILASVRRVQSAFHGIQPLPSTKTMLDMVDEHRVQAAQLKVTMPANFAQVMREYDAAKSAFLASGLDIVPAHNDPMPGNFLIADGKPMMLVDFEFASNNERAYELGLTLCEFFCDEQRIHESVEDLYGRAEWATLARVQACIAIADIKWGLWGCVNQQLNDTWDFDYHKYGTWKFARAAAKIADPRWPQWISAL